MGVTLKFKETMNCSRNIACYVLTFSLLFAGKISGLPSGDDLSELTTTISSAPVSPRCTEEELEQFSLEYEQCHSKALGRLRTEQQRLQLAVINER